MLNLSACLISLGSLIKTTVEIVRTRLDRVYLEAILASEHSRQSKPATEEEVKVLQDELESLYSELLPVAQMSVEQEHLEPALKSISARSGQSFSRSAAAVTYVCTCIFCCVVLPLTLPRSANALTIFSIAWSA